MRALFTLTWKRRCIVRCIFHGGSLSLRAVRDTMSLKLSCEFIRPNLSYLYRILHVASLLSILLCVCVCVCIRVFHRHRCITDVAIRAQSCDIYSFLKSNFPLSNILVSREIMRDYLVRHNFVPFPELTRRVYRRRPSFYEPPSVRTCVCNLACILRAWFQSLGRYSRNTRSMIQLGQEYIGFMRFQYTGCLTINETGPLRSQAIT